MVPRVWSLDWRDHTVPEPNSGCWLWEGQIDGRGYPKQIVSNRHLQVHRVAWAEMNGPIPRGMVVCHRCDVKECVNPDHLFLGTQADNVLDMVKKQRHFRYGQTHCKRGHELTPENTRVRVKPNTTSRTCKQCITDGQRARRQRLKAEAV